MVCPGRKRPKTKFVKSDALKEVLHNAMTYESVNKFEELMVTEDNHEEPVAVKEENKCGGANSKALTVKNKNTSELKKCTKAVNTLTKCASCSLSPVGREKSNEWQLLSVTVDSGACDSVIDPEDVPGYEVRETKASRSGEAFASATGETIPNLGEIELPFQTREQSWKNLTMQACDVSKPLASVKKICQAGHRVVFDEEGSYILNKATGELNFLREDAGNYMLDVWVPPRQASTFGRPH